MKHITVANLHIRVQESYIVGNEGPIVPDSSFIKRSGEGESPEKESGKRQSRAEPKPKGDAMLYKARYQLGWNRGCSAPVPRHSDAWRRGFFYGWKGE
ncbi:hypothetical protein ERIC1_2c03690 [Paenibacillus larvae subsp. larvae DSM 25719]|nr:hypothetical protein BXP28_00370 [Paenibacillus larvae subsp. larvae]ETK26171.1 hypothetical protein ERIC1_2c03690 [Paenibacillus larvae subsp. larvae DSM 25719]